MKKIHLMAIGLIFLMSNIIYAHTDAFKPAFVDMLITPYLSVQKSLSEDNLKSAQTGAEHFLMMLGHGPQNNEAEEAIADLKNPAQIIAEASDINEARAAFLSLSQQMKSLIKHVGTTSDTPLYLSTCGMAFAGKGGIWIQSDKTISNPYYGSKMLRCGSIQEQISGAKQAEKSKHTGDHSEHHH